MSHSPTDSLTTRNQRSARPAAATADAPPAVAGYQILDLLGSGGGGRVYKARHLALDRTVALKILHPGAPADALAGLFAEARAAAGVRHPGIVAVYEVGDSPTPFIAMEFCPGDLRGRLLGGPLAADEAARLALALARAAAAAHAAGVVHRDLKPHNVLLADDGSPKIADFGLARLGTGTGHTVAGRVFGTPAWMSPEQAAGRNEDVGPLSDVYSLGTILYAMLAGEGPFSGTSVEVTLLRVIEQEPVPPRRIRPSVPRDLETICLKCLAKDRKARYAGAAALADDLARFIDGRPIAARPVGVFGRAWRFAKRKPSAAGLLAACFLGPLLLAATAGLFSLELSRSNDRYRDASEELSRSNDRYRAALAKVAAEERDRARALAADGRLGEAVLRLAHAVELLPPGDPAFLAAVGDELAAVTSRMSLPAVVLHSRQVKKLRRTSVALGLRPDGVQQQFGAVTDVTFDISVKGKTFGEVESLFAPLTASGGNDWARPVRTSPPTLFDEQPLPSLRLPDLPEKRGQWLSLWRVPGPLSRLVGSSELDGGVSLIDADLGVEITSALVPGGVSAFPVVTESLVVALGRGGAARLDPREARPTWRVVRLPAGMAACDPAGRTAAVAAPADNAVDLFDLVTGERRMRLPKLPNVKRLAFAPTGNVLTVCRALNPIEDVCDVFRDGKHVFSANTPPADEAVFRPDGLRMALRHRDGPDFADSIIQLDDMQLRRHPPYRGGVRLCWLGDGRKVIPDPAGLRVVTEKDELVALLPHHKPVAYVETAGNRVATVDEDGVGRIFDLGRPASDAPTLKVPANAAAHEAAARRLVREAEAFTGLTLDAGVARALTAAELAERRGE